MSSGPRRAPPMPSLELVEHGLDLRVGRPILRGPRDHGRAVLVLERQRVSDGRHLFRIAAKHLEAGVRLPGRVPFAEQVVDRRAGRARAAGDELDVHPAATSPKRARLEIARSMATKWTMSSTASALRLGGTRSRPTTRGSRSRTKHDVVNIRKALFWNGWLGIVVKGNLDQRARSRRRDRSPRSETALTPASTRWTPPAGCRR